MKVSVSMPTAATQPPLSAYSLSECFLCACWASDLSWALQLIQETCWTHTCARPAVSRASSAKCPEMMPGFVIPVTIRCPYRSGHALP